MKSVRANSSEDVALLVRCFTTTPSSEIWKIMAVVHDLGLMRMRQFELALRFIRLVRGRQGVFSFFLHLQQRSPETIREFVTQTADHIAHGRDREDNDSVGGWSQREIDLLLSKVSFSLLAERPSP